MASRRWSSLAIALILVAVPAVARAQETGGADVTLEIALLPAQPDVGEAFALRVTVDNQGPDQAVGTALSVSIPEQTLFESATTDAGECAFTSYGGGGSLDCSLGSIEPGSDVIVEATLTRTGARESYIGASAYAETEDPDYDNNYGEAGMAADTSRQADVGLVKTAPEDTPVGSSFAYRLRVTNSGPHVAQGVVVVDQLPEGVDYVSSETTQGSCTLHDEPTSGGGSGGGAEPSHPYYGYREVVCDLGSIPSGGSATARVHVVRTSGWEIWNTAWVSTASYDSGYDNDYSTAVLAADPSVSSNVATTMSGPASTPTVGQEFVVTVRVANLGPSSAPDVWTNVYLPEQVDLVASATTAGGCSTTSYDEPQPAYPDKADAPEGYGYPSYGGGSLDCSLGSLGKGASATITLTLTRTAARESWLNAWTSTSNHDPNYDNNYGELMLPPDTSNPADISVDMTAPTRPAVGDRFDYRLSVSNSGPQQADEVTLVDDLPYGVEFEAVEVSQGTCAFEEPPIYYGPAPAEGGSGMSRPFYGFRRVACELGSLPAGQTATVTISVTRTTEWEIWNSAWATTINYDPDYNNDYASVLVAGKSFDGDCDGAGTVEGTKGSDSIVIGDCTVRSGAGGDSVEAAPTSDGDDMTISTGRGRDRVTLALASGSSARRVVEIRTGRGADVVRVTGVAGIGSVLVRVLGGAGNDRVFVDLPGGTSRARIVVASGDGDDRVRSVEHLSELPETIGVSSLRGGIGGDVLQAGSGDDSVAGGRGADELFGGAGNDLLEGGLGRDTCRDGPGADRRRGC